MSVFALWLTMALSQSSDQIISNFEKTVEANEFAMDATISCMDSKTKEMLKANFFEEDPNRVVDFALKNCEEHFKEMRNVLSADQYLADQSDELVEKFQNDVRVTFSQNMQEFFIKPEFAELRAKMATMKLGDCVQDKINLWASQASEPETLAKAAASSCTEEWGVWRAMQGFSLKAQKLGFSVSEFEPSFRAKLVETATVWVFEARAK
ncbi:MAG: hypothetical protein ACKO1O_02265 [Erythrobacter sp.]